MSRVVKKPKTKYLLSNPIVLEVSYVLPKPHSERTFTKKRLQDYVILQHTINLSYLCDVH